MCIEFQLFLYFGRPLGKSILYRNDWKILPSLCLTQTKGKKNGSLYITCHLCNNLFSRLPTPKYRRNIDYHDRSVERIYSKCIQSDGMCCSCRSINTFALMFEFMDALQRTASRQTAKHVCVRCCLSIWSKNVIFTFNIVRHIFVFLSFSIVRVC